MLRLVTAAVVQQLERRLKSREQERVAEAERKAAAARADAEIARARKSLQAVTTSVEQRDTRSSLDAAAGSQLARRDD